MLSNDVQPEKAFSPIFVTVSGTTIFIKLLQPLNVFSTISAVLVTITSSKELGT